MRIYDWLAHAVDVGILPRPEMDPLTERGALQEAQLVESHFDVTTRRVALVIDLRQALQLRTENTAILLFDDVEEFSWLGEAKKDYRTAWTITDSGPNQAAGAFVLYFVPDGEFRIRAASAEFVSGDVQGLPEAPPDFVEDANADVFAGMPSIQSSFEAKHASAVRIRPR